jgi:hypothetical protein
MCKYDDKNLQPIPPTLHAGEKEQVLLPQDETNVHTNDGPCCTWLKGDEQPLKSKGKGCGIHVADWICETTGRLALTPEQIADQMALPKAERLRVFDACKIIYPGKHHDAWWDLEQLRAQTIDAVNIFEYLHPDKIRVWLFNCSSAHEGLTADALNANNMNVNPGGKQKFLWDTIIPLNNPTPQPGKVDTRGMPQSMILSQDHPDEKLRGIAKGRARKEVQEGCGEVQGMHNITDQEGC